MRAPCTHLEAIEGIRTAVVVTTGDRAVPPDDQRELAAKLNAAVFEIHNDHDAFLADQTSFVATTLEAVDHVRNS